MFETFIKNMFFLILWMDKEASLSFIMIMEIKLGMCIYIYIELASDDKVRSSEFSWSWKRS